MSRPGPRAGISRLSLTWYPPALLLIAALIALPAMGRLPVLLLPIGVFLLFFWIFSLGFAIYARLRNPKDLRQ